MKKWIALMLGLLAFDQLTKFLVATYEINYGIIEGFLHITYVRNLGLVFGMFQGATSTHTIVLTIFALIALSVFGVMFYKNDFKDKRTNWYVLALTLLIAGTLGNAIDRLFQPDHGVIDFIDFRGLGNLWTYVFNFADVYLNVGLAILFIDVFFLENKRRKKHE